MNSSSRVGLIWSCCLALVTLGVFTALLVDRDDSTGTTPRAQGLAVTPVKSVSNRDIIMVSRPDEDTGGTVFNDIDQNNIWQTALWRTATVRNGPTWPERLQATCTSLPHPVVDFEADIHSAEVCASRIRFAASSYKNFSDIGPASTYPLETLVCTDALCARFEGVGHDKSFAEPPAFEPDSRAIIIH